MLYNRYKDYAETLGLDIESDKRFAERVRRLAGVADRKKRVGDRNERVWKGIGLIEKVVKPDVDDFDAADLTLGEFGVDTTGAHGALGARPLYSEKSAGESNHRETGEIVERAPAAPSAPAEAITLNEEIILGVMDGHSWTQASLMAEIVKLGYSAADFPIIFTKLAEDSRVKSSGTTPVYYSLQDVIE
jgi:hypothetical protein